MKFYYGASIWGADGDANFNNQVIQYLKQFGDVLSEHLFSNEYKLKEHLSMTMIHDRDISWIRESDKMIMEVSAPSLGVGYEIREGIVRCKPILCLWRKQEKRLSAMISGSSGLTVREYVDFSDAKVAIDDFLSQPTS